jgi:hypothetical protein
VLDGVEREEHACLQTQGVAGRSASDDDQRRGALVGSSGLQFFVGFIHLVV